jgi:hypothetical protein
MNGPSVLKRCRFLATVAASVSLPSLVSPPAQALSAEPSEGESPTGFRMEEGEC